MSFTWLQFNIIADSMMCSILYLSEFCPFYLLQYSAWFEELRKQRVAELKRELEKSENSIGSVPMCSPLPEHFLFNFT